LNQTRFPPPHPTIPHDPQVQTIGLLSHLRANGIYGPFMILGPLSVLPNWVSEVERWCPSQPVILYHGSKQERAELRARHMPTGAARVLRLLSRVRGAW
jgi:hypothetical protein